jgi:hypothetical protein
MYVLGKRMDTRPQYQDFGDGEKRKQGMEELCREKKGYNEAVDEMGLACAPSLDDVDCTRGKR